MVPYKLDVLGIMRNEKLSQLNRNKRNLKEVKVASLFCESWLGEQGEYLYVALCVEAVETQSRSSPCGWGECGHVPYSFSASTPETGHCVHVWMCDGHAEIRVPWCHLGWWDGSWKDFAVHCCSVVRTNENIVILGLWVLLEFNFLVSWLSSEVT